MSNPSPSGNAEAEEKTGCCRRPFRSRCGKRYFPQRIFLAILLHLCLQNNFTTRVVLNVAIVEMVAPPPEENNTHPACPQYNQPPKTQQGGKFPWPSATRSLVLYAFYIGYTITQVPGGWMADKYGGRPVIVSSVFFTTLSTVIFPVLTQKFGHWAAVILRFCVGLSHGLCMPALSSMVSTWFPPDEKPMWGGIAYAGTNLGTIIGNMFSGLLIHKFDAWPVAFYFWASYSALFFVLILIFLYSFPDTHPFITKEEADFIRSKNMSNRAMIGRSIRTPWKKILLNVPFWANVTSQFGHNYIYLSLVTYLPTYMRDILQFDVAHDGFFSAMPFVALWATSLVLSGTARYFIKCMGERAFNSILGCGSNVGCALLILGATYAGCDRHLCIALYMISMVVKAFYYVTLTVNLNALSKNYGGIMFGICNALGSISGIVSNFIIGHLTKGKQIYEWRMAFWICLGVCIFTSIIFVIFSSAERQKFDYAEPGEE